MGQAKKFMLNAKNRQKTYPTLRLFCAKLETIEWWKMDEKDREKVKFQYKTNFIASFHPQI